MFTLILGVPCVLLKILNAVHDEHKRSGAKTTTKM